MHRIQASSAELGLQLCDVNRARTVDVNDVHTRFQHSHVGNGNTSQESTKPELIIQDNQSKNYHERTLQFSLKELSIRLSYIQLTDSIYKKKTLPAEKCFLSTNPNKNKSPKHTWILRKKD